MKDDPVYTPSDCFDTFPFPNPIPTSVQDAAIAYYEFRNSLMQLETMGITDLLNKFDNKAESSMRIAELRELHAAMDRAVLEAYGWDDLAATARCEFLLDYEEEGTGDSGLGFGDLGDENQSLSASPKSRRKLPWRLRWPDDFRDEVLARLLELNEQRHKEELLAGSSQLSAKKETKATKKTAKSTKATPGQALPGFDDVDG